MHLEVRYEEFVDPVDGTRWRVDLGFLGSRWRCRWGDGCQGILDERRPELEQGCCSVGAELLDDDEAMLVSALAATLPPERFEQHAAAADGVFADDDRRHTRVVEGACIFFNRPGFAGGTGCALHLAALDDAERPMDVKPAVCWQLPLKVDTDADGVRTLRRWGRPDWGPGGASMAWCCTEEPDCYDGDAPVAESMAAELRALVGPEVAVEIRRRLP